MLGFMKKNADRGRFVEIARTNEITGKDIADKILIFIKTADFKDPYPEFTVNKSDLEDARISQYELLGYINHLNKDNKDIQYSTQHPKKKDGFMDYDIIQFVWERKLYEPEYQEPIKVQVVK